MQQNTRSNAKSKENDICAVEKHLCILFVMTPFMIVSAETQET